MAADATSLEALERATDYNVEIEIEDETGKIETIVCRKLGFGAMAEAAAFVKDQRRREYTAGAVTMNLEVPNILPLHAETLRGIACTNISVYDVVHDHAGRLKLCQLAINKARNGQPALTYEQVRDRLAHTDVAAMFRKLCILSGIYALADQEGKSPADPSRTSAPSTTGDAPPNDP